MKTPYTGLRIAVAGMGVSGIAIAKAAQKMGAIPVVLEQRPGDVPSVMKAVDHLQALGIEAITGWPGRLDPEEFDLLVVSPGLPPSHPVIRDMAGKVIGEIEFAYQISEAPILAITGTNGKSTTTVMLWLALKGAGCDAVLCGNIAGSGYPEQTLTDAAMDATTSSVLVAEVSSAQLETVVEFAPCVACITNITSDHMDRYGNLQNYENAKLNLVKKMDSAGMIVLNRDANGIDSNKLLSTGTQAKLAEFDLEIGGPHTRIEEGRICFSGEWREIRDLPFLGEHNLINAMTAWEMAVAFCEPNSGMLRGLLSFEPLSNRMEPMGEKGGVLVINNSMCTNPEAVVASSRGLPGKHHLLMGGKTKDNDFAPLKKYLEITDHIVYIFGPEPGQFASIIGREPNSFPDMKSAFLAATESAKVGETILLSPGCASAEPYTNFMERGDAFRQIAKEWLENDTESEV